MSLGHMFGNSDREAPVGLDLVRARLLLQQSDRLRQALESLLLELLRRAVALCVRLLRDQGIEELTLAVMLPCLGERLGQRPALAEAAPARRGRRNHAGDRRTFPHDLPLLLCEIRLVCHRVLSVRAARPSNTSGRGTYSGSGRTRLDPAENPSTKALGFSAWPRGTHDKWQTGHELSSSATRCERER